MTIQHKITFHEALDIIESLPEYQQEDLINIIRHRLVEQKRQLLADNIKEAREEYARGDIKRGTIDDLIKELSEWEHSFGVKLLQGLSSWLSKDVHLCVMILKKHWDFWLKPPFLPQLETHKLKGKLYGSWACSAGYDLRIVFDFVKSKTQKEDEIFLIEIGTHDEVY